MPLIKLLMVIIHILVGYMKNFIFLKNSVFKIDQDLIRHRNREKRLNF